MTRSIASSLIPLLLAATVCLAETPPPEGPSEVTLVRTAGSYRLLRNGQPYFIKGGAGDSHLEDLVAAGGNSIRTWGADNIGELLDKAQRLGLTVTIGFWLGHEQDGFNYQSGEAVTRQLEGAKANILRYKDHPALLMWAVGNEMEGAGGEADNPAIWYAVDHIARMAKELDPHHPTMTVIAEVGGKRIENINRFCPDVDIVGINSYGGINSVVDRYVKAGGTKPCVITEFGPLGQWEVSNTVWKAPLEMSSTAKAEWYSNGYRDAVERHRDLCLGSYAFAWGCKQEATATWYGLFLKDGSRLAGVESLIAAWGGKPPTNRCPVLKDLKVDKMEGLNPGDIVHAALDVSDPDGDKLTVKWSLLQEAETYAAGADNLPDQQGFSDAVVKNDGVTAEVRMPKSGGGYRLFACVYDGHGNAAVANVPLFVKGKVIPPPPPAGDVPFVVYGEHQERQPYIASGYMGNYGAIKMDMVNTNEPFSGNTCIRVDYTSAEQWGGVVWQSPPQDWGDRPGGYDLRKANELVFQARGAEGGEKVSFGVGLIGSDKPHHDSTKASIPDVVLTTDWKQYVIPLAGRDLSCIKSGFLWTLGGQGKPVTFYLDDIRFIFDSNAPPAAAEAGESAKPFVPPSPALPFDIYSDDVQKPPYVPSGYMGSIDAITMDPRCPTDPHSGATCLRASYTASDGWGGVVWQSPPDDWGDKPGGYNLGNANALTFWGRGDEGNEVVSFGVGAIGSDKPYPDTDKASLEKIPLSLAWQKYTIPLSGKNLSCIKSGFIWTVAGQKKPVVFFLDDIQYVFDPDAVPAAAKNEGGNP